MNDEKVKKFLRYYYSGIVGFALALAALNDREEEAVKLCGRRGLTIEQAAEIADVSPNTMKSRWESARKRLQKAWNGIEWIEIITETVE